MTSLKSSSCNTLKKYRRVRSVIDMDIQYTLCAAVGGWLVHRSSVSDGGTYAKSLRQIIFVVYAPNFSEVFFEILLHLAQSGIKFELRAIDNTSCIIDRGDAKLTRGYETNKPLRGAGRSKLGSPAQRGNRDGPLGAG